MLHLSFDPSSQRVNWADNQNHSKSVLFFSHFHLRQLPSSQRVELMQKWRRKEKMPGWMDLQFTFRSDYSFLSYTDEPWINYSLTAVFSPPFCFEKALERAYVNDLVSVCLSVSVSVCSTRRSWARELKFLGYLKGHSWTPKRLVQILPTLIKALKKIIKVSTELKK